MLISGHLRCLRLPLPGRPWYEQELSAMLLRKIASSRCTSGLRQFTSKHDKHHMFALETEVKETAHPNHFTAHVSKNWSVGDAPNGGYLMGIAIAAARKVINFRDPLSMTAYYTNKALEGEPVDVVVQTLNTTKGTATVSVSLTQGGALRSHYVGTFGTLSSMKGLNYTNMPLSAPHLPPPEDCFDCSAKLRKIFGDNLQVAKRVQFRSPHDDPFVTGALSNKTGTEASLSCWVRFDDGQEPCLRSSAFFLDALPPPILGIAKSNWVPTLEYTVHFWQRPDLSRRGFAGAHHEPYWLRCRYSTPFALNGMLYTDAELWSEDGTALLATARQLARVLVPR